MEWKHFYKTEKREMDWKPKDRGNRNTSQVLKGAIDDGLCSSIVMELLSLLSWPKSTDM